MLIAILKSLVIPLGFEPKTHSLEGCCSNPTELRNHHSSIYKNRTYTSWVKAKCADHYTKILYSPNKTCKGEYRHLFMQVNNTKVITLNIIMCNQKITLYTFHQDYLPISQCKSYSNFSFLMKERIFSNYNK